MSIYDRLSLQDQYDALQERKASFASMTELQREAIKAVLDALNSSLEYIDEYHDIRLSDLHQLNMARWKLYHSTKTEPTERQVERFKEYGIGEYATKATEEVTP